LDIINLGISLANVFFIEDRELAIVTGQFNALATFIDLKNKKIIGQMANATGDDFFMLTPDLMYMG
jgi:hypothetical protein